MSCLTSSYILVINCLSYVELADVFSHPLSCVFTVGCCAVLSVWRCPTCLYLLLFPVLSRSNPKNPCLLWRFGASALWVLSRTFNVLGLTFSLSAHFGELEEGFIVYLCMRLSDFPGTICGVDWLFSSRHLDTFVTEWWAPVAWVDFCFSWGILDLFEVST